MLPAAVLLLCILLGLCGCGRKEWPSPQAQEDRFTWGEINGQRLGGCLAIEAELKGAYWNLAALELEIENRSEPCPGCPFQPTSAVSLPMHSSNVNQDQEQLQISFCDIPRSGFTRWRLKGINRYRQIQDLTSQVYILE
jgi:hypothetical protein